MWPPTISNWPVLLRIRPGLHTCAVFCCRCCQGRHNWHSCPHGYPAWRQQSWVVSGNGQLVHSEHASSWQKELEREPVVKPWHSVSQCLRRAAGYLPQPPPPPCLLPLRRPRPGAAAPSLPSPPRPHLAHASGSGYTPPLPPGRRPSPSSSTSTWACQRAGTDWRLGVLTNQQRGAAGGTCRGRVGALRRSHGSTCQL